MMPWFNFRDIETNHSQKIFQDSIGNRYRFSRDKVNGRRLNFDMPITFDKEGWEKAVDRGLGTHATSIVTRARAHIGQYISLIEEEYGSIENASPAKKEKCEAIQRVQAELIKLYEDERKIDPADFVKGPIEEHRFKARVMTILSKLSSELTEIDKKHGSVMTGRAAHIVIAAHTAVNSFNWPFEPDSPDAIEKNTRRRSITEKDQLIINEQEKRNYQARDEFPNGLSKHERSRLSNVLVQQVIPKEDKREFKNGVDALGETTLALSSVLRWSRRKNRLKPGEEDISMEETRESQLVSDVIAEKTASEMSIEISGAETPIPPLETNINALIDTKYKDAKINRDYTRKRVIWHLFQQGKINKIPIKDVNDYLQPLYNLNTNYQSESDVLQPSGPQGTLFARGSVFGAVYDIADPVFSVIEDMGKKDPIMGSLALAVWAGGAVYVAGVAAAAGSSVGVAKGFLALGAILQKSKVATETIHQVAHLVSPVMQKVYAGVMPITGQSSASHIVMAQVVDGFVMAKLAYFLMTGKSIKNKDIHSIDYNILNFVKNNPVESGLIVAACYALGLGTVHLLGDTGDIGSWTFFDEMTAAIKPGVVLADIFLAGREAALEHLKKDKPEALSQFIEKTNVLLVRELLNDLTPATYQQYQELKLAIEKALLLGKIDKIYDELLIVANNYPAANLKEKLKQHFPAQDCLKDDAFWRGLQISLSIHEDDIKALKEVIRNAAPGEQFKDITTFVEGYNDTNIKEQILHRMSQKFEIQFKKITDEQKAVQESYNKLINIAIWPNDTNFDSDDKKALSSLFKSKKYFSLATSNLKIAEFDGFLEDKYPDIVVAMGVAPQDPEQRRDYKVNLRKALKARFLDDVLATRASNPKVWDVLKQFPDVMEAFSGKSPYEIAQIPIPPRPASTWQMSIIPAIFRLLHAIVGLFAFIFTYSRLESDPNYRQKSGFNNLRGLLEGIPYIPGLVARIFHSLNNTMILGRARILDKAMSYQLPKNGSFSEIRKFIGRTLVSLGAAIVSLLIITPLDLLIFPFSYAWNVSLGNSLKEVLYKFPLIGPLFERVIEGSFEKRAMRRFIQNDVEKQLALGDSRSLTVGRAGDIALYRMSHEKVVLLVPPESYSSIKEISYGNLLRMLEESNPKHSHITERILSYIKARPSKDKDSKTSLILVLSHIFPEEAQMLKIQYRREHLRDFDKDQTKASTECDNAVCYTLEKLLQAELQANPSQKTGDSCTKITQLLTNSPGGHPVARPAEAVVPPPDPNEIAPAPEVPPPANLGSGSNPTGPPI